MSFQYDQYLARHRANVKRGFDWLSENLPGLMTNTLTAGWNTEFAHDRSKNEPDEYEAYDAYFYGNNRNEKYNKAIKIESSELFEYGMRTNVGYAFVYGNLKAVDTVSYPEINGEYMYIEKIEEHYNMHTRTVTTTDSKGKTHTKTETYWSWDYAGSEEQRCSEITFLGHIFPSNKVEFPSTEHIDTIKESSHVRHKYYGVDTEYIGTIFTELRDKTISDNSSFYENSTIEETVDYLESDWELWLFWVIWIIVIGLCVFGFYYIDNEWIEN